MKTIKSCGRIFTGSPQVIHRVIHMPWFRFRRSSARETTSADVMQALVSLRQQLDNTRDELEALRAQHLKLRGRVYAIWGKGSDPAEGAETAQELPINDPRLTKDQLRARVLPHGKRFKHTN